jgi:hypothetical protein
VKDNYDLSKMRKVPHPLGGRVRLISHLGRLSDAEFERKLQNMEPDEQAIARSLRKLRRADPPSQTSIGASATM